MFRHILTVHYNKDKWNEISDCIDRTVYLYLMVVVNTSIKVLVSNIKMHSFVVRVERGVGDG